MGRIGILFLFASSCFAAVAPGMSAVSGFVGMALGTPMSTSDGVIIETVLQGGTAQRGGIAGDGEEMLVAVDGVRLAAPIDLPSVVALIRGPIGTNVTLRVRRSADKIERDVVLQRQFLPLWASSKGVGFEPAELDGLVRFEASLAQHLAAARAARDALLTASLTDPLSQNDIVKRVEALANAELRLALAEAEGLAAVVREFSMPPAKRAAIIKTFAMYDER